MNCPNCNEQMHKVYTKTKTNEKIELNQCPSCGGIWFDKWELYPITKEKDKKIDKVQTRKLRKITPIISTVVSCPKCHIKLNTFKDSDLPSELQIHRCNKCGGFWFNNGEHQEYKKQIKTKIKAKIKPAKSTKTQPISKKSHIYNRIGNFLSTPISSIGLMPIKNYNSKESIAAGKITTSIMTIVNTIMKLLIGKK